ncbi:MAG TPA: DinB family protein [Ureibacillus sp.]|nr:DinB family protein [Ureibacillus sp.]
MEKRHEILFNQLESYRAYVLAILNDVLEDEAIIIPAGFNNNIRWNAGHIYLDQYLWIEHLTKEKTEIPEGFRTWFGYGTSPQNFTKETPSLGDLIKLLKEQPNRIKEVYGHRLEEEFSPTEMGMSTIEQVLVRTIFHEGMHLQTILDLKKLIKLVNV